MNTMSILLTILACNSFFLTGLWLGWLLSRRPRAQLTGPARTDAVQTETKTQKAEEAGPCSKPAYQEDERQALNSLIERLQATHADVKHSSQPQQRTPVRRPVRIVLS